MWLIIKSPAGSTRISKGVAPFNLLMEIEAKVLQSMGGKGASVLGAMKGTLSPPSPSADPFEGYVSSGKTSSSVGEGESGTGAFVSLPIFLPVGRGSGGFVFTTFLANP
jgi:hypothetical protein